MCAPLQTKLPCELISLIDSYNPEHRDHMRFVLEEIPHVAIFRRCAFLEYAYSYETDFEFEEFVSQNVEDPELFVSVLSECTCCTRHVEKKPKCLTDPNGSPSRLTNTEIMNRRFFSDHKYYGIFCHCPCRHWSRIMCETFS